MHPPPCIHASGAGLCPACQADYEEDPAAWLEFGQHPAGIAAWKAEQEQIDRDAAELASLPPASPDPSIPL